LNEEILLLIKSKYAVIFLETVDEEYVLRQLGQIAGQLNLSYYQWSVTEGLRLDHRESSYYQTKDVAAMLNMVLGILKCADEYTLKAGLFVFEDFESYLDNPMVLRLFKDLVNKIKNSKTTVVIVASAYKLPQDLEPYTAHIIGGFPAEEEISNVIKETIDELSRSNPQIRVSLPGMSKG
jgi:ABC-type ATPase with predicted acetyltransferase domain